VAAIRVRVIKEITAYNKIFSDCLERQHSSCLDVLIKFLSAGTFKTQKPDASFIFFTARRQYAMQVRHVVFFILPACLAVCPNSSKMGLEQNNKNNSFILAFGQNRRYAGRDDAGTSV